jgi:hypothetical protein
MLCFLQNLFGFYFIILFCFLIKFTAMVGNVTILRTKTILCPHYKVILLSNEKIMIIRTNLYRFTLIKHEFLLNLLLCILFIVEVTWRRMLQSQALLCIQSKHSFLQLIRLVLKQISGHIHKVKLSVCQYSIIGRYVTSKAKKKICGFPVSSYKNLGRVGRF